MALNSKVQVEMPKKGVIVRNSGKHRYVYHVTRTYRNELGQPTNDRVSIGRLDETTGMLIPNDAYYDHYATAAARVEMLPTCDSVKSIGAFFLFERIFSSLSVDSMLESGLGAGRARDVELVAIYMACRGNVMDHALDWCEACVPTAETITSQSTSALFFSMDLGMRMSFFRKWVAARCQSEYLAYDVTSVSSYAKGIEDTEWGHNRDGERLPQINMAMYLGQASHLPVFYCTYPGSVVDKSHLPYMMAYNQDLGIRDVSFVMDRGFCTTANIGYMATSHIMFVVGVEVRHKATRSAIDAVRDNMESMRNLVAKGVYARQVHGRFYGVASTMHVFFDPANAERQRQDLFRRVGCDAEELSQREDLSKAEARRLSRYHHVAREEDGGFSFELDYDRIDSLAANNGFFCLLTNDASLSSEDVLRIYRDKDTIEKGFDDLKNHLDMDRLRTHVAETTDGKVFCAFLSLIAVFELENHLSGFMKDKNMSKDRVISELEKIRVITTSNGRRLMNPLTKTQKTILEAFSLTEDDMKGYVATL